MPHNSLLIARFCIDSKEYSNLNWLVELVNPYKEFDSIEVPDKLLEHIFFLYKQAYKSDSKLLIKDKYALFKYNRWILLENEDGNICTFMLYSSKNYGIKLGITASDGSRIAKKALIMFHIKAFNVVGVIGEISPPLEKKIIDEIPKIKASKVSAIIDKVIISLKDGYHYKREITNIGKKIKILVGRLKDIRRP